MTKGNMYALCPLYFEELVGLTRVSYRAKIEMCDDTSTCTNCASVRICYNERRSAAFCDTQQYRELVVLSTSHVTLQQIKAYNSLDGHKYFTSRWGTSIAAKQLSSQRIAVLTKDSYDALSWLN